MKKNFSVNIGQRLFNIDDDAFDQLSNYLSGLRNYFQTEEGHDEILADIEMRISELLEQKAQASGQFIIHSAFIDEVIAEMGKPGEFSEGSGTSQDNSTRQARLYRNKEQKIVAGVASGIAAWLGSKTLYIRLLFIILTIIYGIGPLVYVVLWLILPVAETTAEKLAMQGQNVTVENLRRELLIAGQGIQHTGHTALGGLRKLLQESFSILGRLIRWVIQLLGRVTGLFLLSFVILIFVGVGLAFLIREDSGMGGYIFDSVTLYQIFQWMVPSSSVQYLFYIAFVLVLTSLSGLLIYAGLRLLLNWPPLQWQVVLVFIGLLAGGMVIGGAAIMRYSASTNQTESRAVSKAVMYKPARLTVAGNNWDAGAFRNALLARKRENKGGDVLNEINLSFRPSPNDSLIVSLISSSSAQTTVKASEYLQNLAYSYTLNDTLLSLDPYFTIPFADGMHYQEMNVVISIPVNKEVYIDKNISWKVRWSDFADADSDGGLYLMHQAGLARPATYKTDEPQSVQDTVTALKP